MSDGAELTLVVLLAFGYLIFGSTRALLLDTPKVLTNRWALSLVAFELAVLCIVAWLGRIRGWSFRTLGLQPSWFHTAVGLLLFFAAMFIWTFTVLLARAVTDIPDPPIRVANLSLWAVLLVSVVNPFFEEVLVVGYVMHRLGAQGVAFAMTASTLLRFLYHTYQGPISVCFLALGLLFAFAYAKERQLWPLIFAHAMMDVLALHRVMDS